MPFVFESTELPGVIRVIPRVFPDYRGYFLEAYKRSAFEEAGIADDFRQCNQSRSRRNVIRGLHYQIAPQAQAKLVRVVSGCIWDVVVDIRPESPTYGQWTGAELSIENQHQLYIPEGFAHGFAVRSEWAEVVYLTTAEYAPDCERGIRYNDPTLAIGWGVTTPIVSDKDAVLPLLDPAG